uniref:Matrix extracellular phosphoglycoprotein n=1 Tax=Microcebus murinus TaxID=30608 RepID=A0A8C5VEU8_MICMU
MQVVCVGLLFFTVAWAAPTFQPQTEKTKQGCVEEQRKSVFQNLPRPMLRPKSCSASGPASASVRKKKTKTISFCAIWTGE